MDWAAIIADAILASAIAFVLLAFGAAVGLTATSPFEGRVLSGAVLAVAIASSMRATDALVEEGVPQGCG